MATKLPDFLIVGAMKGGTTRLYEMICEHPRVLPASQKEIHYFTMNRDKPVSWYQEHFPETPAGFLTGEASPTYLSEASPELVHRIHETVPEARIILITRDPVARAVSHFRHLQAVNKIPALQELSAEEFFNRPFRAPPGKGDPKLQWYLTECLRMSRYAAGYKLFAAVFGTRNVLTIDNEELRNQPHVVMERVFEFLGLSRFDGKSFGEIRYSNSSTPNELSAATRQRLENEFSPDYSHFRGLTDPTPAPPEVATSFLEGREGWLYLTGGTNSVLSMFTDSPLDEAKIRSWVALLRARRDKAAALGIPYLHVTAPDKLSIYPEHFPGALASGPIQRLHEAIASEAPDLERVYVDVREDLIRAKSESDVFWRTDTHWSVHGCAAAYRAICSRLGFPAAPDLLQPAPSVPVLRDLGVRLRPMQPEMTPTVTADVRASRTWANELVSEKEALGRDNDPELHVGCAVTYEDPQAPVGSSVLLFGDSFAEYRPSLLTGMLTRTFRTVTFVWSASVDWELVSRVRPDIVLSELTERFMGAVPGDQLDTAELARMRAGEARRRGPAGPMAPRAASAISG